MNLVSLVEKGNKTDSFWAEKLYLSKSKLISLQKWSINLIETTECFTGAEIQWRQVKLYLSRRAIVRISAFVQITKAVPELVDSGEVAAVVVSVSAVVVASLWLSSRSPFSETESKGISRSTRNTALLSILKYFFLFGNAISYILARTAIKRSRPIELQVAACSFTSLACHWRNISSAAIIFKSSSWNKN